MDYLARARRAGLEKLLLVVCVLGLVHCTGPGSTSQPDSGVPLLDLSMGPPARANIVFVLADDLSWNLVQYMPTVLKMQKMGTTFTRYFVTDSLCCPSRSSILTGQYPHNTGIYKNSGDGGGYTQFELNKKQDDAFATVLQKAGYKAAMMGKYLNGYEPKDNQADPGWSNWDVAGQGGYGEYDYELNQDGKVHVYRDGGNNYLTDVLSGLGNDFVKGAAGGPFLLEAASFAPHAPYTPAPRHIGMFNFTLPIVGAVDKRNTNQPKWLAQHPDLTPADITGLGTAYNLRAEAVQAVDDMIAALMATLVSKGLDKNTYVIFSSDNGYHMGEHMLLTGKETAFDHDINVPLIVVGPNVPGNVKVDNIVENIDLCPTFAEMAGTPAPASADGRSLLPLMLGQAVTDWRNVALIEHHGPDLETTDPGDPDNEDRTTKPNSYNALRMPTSLFVNYYSSGETEYYDLTMDKDELNNTAASLTPAQVAAFRKTITAIVGCKGNASCWAAQHM